MRCLSLTLQAFGPFANSEHINFTQFGQNALFLINGVTGAGKSSILDAICFALYGETVDAARDAEQMRCDFAEVDNLTQVVFCFQLGKKRYKIKRIPTQERAKKSGEGTTSQAHEAYVYELDTTGAEKTLLSDKKATEATKLVEQLTGLTASQFRQVIVLPQGKFRELLLANSLERERIFSQLFQTQFYQRLEEKLASQAKAIKTQVIQHQSHCQQQLEQENMADIASLTIHVDQLASQLTQLTERQQQLNQQKQQAFAKLQTAEQLVEQFNQQQQLHYKLAELTKQQSHIDVLQQTLTQAQLAQQCQPSYAALQTVTTRVTNTTQQIQHLTQQQEQHEAQLAVVKRRFTEHEIWFNGLDQHYRQLEQYQGLQQDFKQLASAKQQLDGFTQQLASMRADYKAIKQQHDDVEDGITTTTTQLVQLDNWLTQHQHVSVQLAELKQEQHQRDMLAKLQQQLDEKQQQLVEQQGKLSHSDQHTTVLKTTALTLKQTWHLNQAAVLATELTDNSPCPVCGSLTHPDKAIFSNVDNHIDLTQVENAQQAYEAQLAETGQLKTQVKLCQQQIASLQQQQQQMVPLVSALSASHFAHKLVELQQMVASFTAKQQQKKQLSDSLNKQQTIFKTCQQQLHEHTLLGQDLKKDLAQAEAQCQQLQAKLPTEVKTEAVLQGLIAQKEQHIAHIKQTFNQSQSQLQNLTQQSTVTQTQLTEKQQQLEQLQTEQHHQQHHWQQLLTKHQFVDTAAFNTAIANIDQIEMWQDKLQTYHANKASTQAQLQQLDILLKHKTQPNIEQLTQAYQQLNHDLAAVTQQQQQCHTDHDRQSRLLNQLTVATTELQDLETSYGIIGRLSDVAKGDNPHKVSFSRYVLGVLLDEVLNEATGRLQLMTKGRYTLVRQLDKGKGRAAAGLALEVEDTYTGKLRSVATLSGGESFMAALAMALALSDVVQSYAGGIRMDTLFIDEGFGSLDQESLDLAIKTLIDLQHTGRIVGIISHVAELKEQLTQRIDVIAGRQGSSVNIVVPNRKP